MGKVSVAVTGGLLCAALFSSCTCRNQVESPAALQEPRTGFQATEATKPVARIVPPTPTQSPAATEAVAEAEATVAPAAELPSDFPPDVPVYKDAAVAQVQELANNARNVIFRTPAAVPDVASFYQDSMIKGGWKITQQLSRENHAFFTFQKGDMLANVTITEDVHNPGNQILVIMYEELQPVDEF